MNSVNPYASRLTNYVPGVTGGSLLTPAAPAAFAPTTVTTTAVSAPAPAAAPVATAANPALDGLRAQFMRLSQYTQMLQLKLQLLTIQSQINNLMGQVPAAPAPTAQAPTSPQPKPQPKPTPKPDKPTKPETKPAPEKPEPKPEPKPEKPKPKPKPDKPEGSGPFLKKGLAGKPVKQLQSRLKKLGFDPGPVDGLFGDKTLAAVKQFQKRKGLKVDGGVGDKTWDALGIHAKGKPKRIADMVVKTPKGPMVRRQGKLIHQSIAKGFDRMVAAAKKDGVTLSINSAYRSYQEQVVLWNRYGQDPARVARPGTSNHESGQAIDFHNTPGAWAWLKANAHKYGLKNYPPEPWHYSPTGSGVPGNSEPALSVMTFGA